MRADYMRAYRDQRRARGVCIDCPAPAGRYARCIACRLRQLREKREALVVHQWFTGGSPPDSRNTPPKAA
jgi:hypothetical protein